MPLGDLHDGLRGGLPARLFSALCRLLSVSCVCSFRVVFDWLGREGLHTRHGFHAQRVAIAASNNRGRFLPRQYPSRSKKVQEFLDEPRARTRCCCFCLFLGVSSYRGCGGIFFFPFFNCCSKFPDRRSEFDYGLFHFAPHPLIFCWAA